MNDLKIFLFFCISILLMILFGMYQEHDKRLYKVESVLNRDLMDKSYNDLELLELLGQGECSICDTTEILLVMSVAVNRVHDHRFPSTLTGVLYQENQFHGIHRRDYRKGEVYVSPKVKYCAELIMNNGPINDKVVGFLYPSKIQTVKGQKWYDKMKDKVTIEERYHHFMVW